MAHFPKPFWRKARKAWFVQIDKKFHNLGAEKEPAFKEYHRLMALENRQEAIHQVGNVVAILDLYLDWCQRNRAPDTYEWYSWRINLFCKSIPAGLQVGSLKHYHLDQWLDKNKWGASMRHSCCRAIMRGLSWAKKKGYIDASPLTDYEKPRPKKRNVVIPPAEFDRILQNVKGPFVDLLVVTWETAARPQESLIVEARHVDVENKRWVFPVDESKGEQAPRIVYLNEKALEITKRLMEKYPAGPLFRNRDGVPWTTDAVNCAFIRLQKKIGKKYCLYNLRHSWLDGALKRGVDALTCAILMGHRDPGTIAKVYQHLSQSPDYLHGAIKKATA